MKSYRQRFFDQYTYRTVRTPDGKSRRVMVYQGLFYRWDLPASRLRMAKLAHVLLPLLSALLLIVSSVQPVQANMNRAVAILSIAALAFMLPEFCGCLLFALRRKPLMTELEWNEIRFSVLVCSFVHALLLSAGAALAIAITVQTDRRFWICLGYAAAALCPIILHAIHRSLPLRTSDSAPAG